MICLAGLWTPIDTATVITNVSDSDYKDDRAGTYNNKLLDGATVNGNKHTIKGMTVHNTVRGPVPGAVTVEDSPASIMPDLLGATAVR